jgi:phosphoribosylformylglycinamidine synthase
LLVAVAEMAMASGIGANLTISGPDLHAKLFGEDQARYVLAVAEGKAAEVLANAEKTGVPARRIGSTTGNDLVVNGEAVAVADLKAAHEGWFPAFMA